MPKGEAIRLSLLGTRFMTQKLILVDTRVWHREFELKSMPPKHKTEIKLLYGEAGNKCFIGQPNLYSHRKKNKTDTQLICI